MEKYMPNKQFFIGFFVALLAFIAMYDSHNLKDRPIYTTTVQCKHPHEREIITKYVAYTIFVDSMYVAKKRDIKRFTDSLNKYKIK